MPDAVTPAPSKTADRRARVDGAGSQIERRVAELRDLAVRSPAQARDEAWAWLGDLKSEAAGDRERTSAKLNELFRLGAPPSDIDGRTEGILVTPLIGRPVDLVLRTLTGAWMPWLGKRFDQGAARGDNVLRSDVRWPAKLFWPLYGTKSLGDARAAFDFETRVEAGKDDPDRDVLVIDYSVVDSNPRFIIKQIRDELVEIVPGANLGKILWRSGDSYSLIGYFALRSDL
jgi:hypothetical protein